MPIKTYTIENPINDNDTKLKVRFKVSAPPVFSGLDEDENVWDEDDANVDLKIRDVYEIDEDGNEEDITDELEDDEWTELEEIISELYITKQREKYADRIVSGRRSWNEI